MGEGNKTKKIFVLFAKTSQQNINIVQITKEVMGIGLGFYLYPVNRIIA
jgi:hypothetical protein